MLFINLVLGVRTDNEKKLVLLQSVFDAVYNPVVMYKGKFCHKLLCSDHVLSSGSLNKVFMFDKVCQYKCA